MVFVTTDMEKARKETEMLELVAGGTRALREKPTAACYINIATPLRHNEESVQKLLYFAEKGLPIIYRPSLVMRGMTTPITVPGFLALNNSSQLAGVVLSQLKNEGAPFIRCGCAGGTFDMGTSVGLLSAPEVRGFNEDLAHFYRLPCFGIGGTTDSKAVDAQAAMEAALTLLTSTQAGAQLIHDVGYMESGATGSLEQLVIAHEMIGWVKAYMKTPEINDETLALDVIAEVGPDGAFIETEHTLNHFREDHYPELSDRKRFHRWFEDGGSTMKERARVQLERILSEKPQQKLPTDISSRIEEMI
jgi:trimethylamine--corrinoid protein Co-methyltransferase